jgi:hypothetical protein
VRGQRKFGVILINKTRFLFQHPDKDAQDDEKISKLRAAGRKRQLKPAVLQEGSSSDDEEIAISKRHSAKKLLRIESSTSDSEEDEPLKERLRRNPTVPVAG